MNRLVFVIIALAIVGSVAFAQAIASNTKPGPAAVGTDAYTGIGSG